ncbi:MAG TPA: hypothetical protein VFA41_06250 [Ktedonobacteraceae bacterium]|jgi:hypothetical protein|nr:hypothetical protein [Ktedonobacteraceae bacterium]
MSQQLLSDDFQTAKATKPLPFDKALLQLPRQYLKVLFHPSEKTFKEEMGKASWGITLFQLYLLIVVTVFFSYLAHILPSSALHSTSNLVLGSFRPFAFLPSPYNGMLWILSTFCIGLGTAYLFSKLWHGKGTFVAHTYSLLLCTVPLVTISGALLLIPSSGIVAALLFTLLVAIFIYRMVLHTMLIMAVHDLSAGWATLIVLIIPMLIVILAILALLIFATEGTFLEGLLTFDWISHGSKKHEEYK